MFDSDGSFVDRWIDDDSLDCASVHRPADEDAPRDGIYLARYYTFSMSEAADVAITLESPIDTYLYLLEGKGTDGAVLHKNDDIDYEADNLNSRIRETLQSGDYTIEATTYDAVYPTPVIEFRLTTSGITLQPSADDDRAALTTLYHATNGPNWRRSNNWLTDAPLGEWYGVTTGADGRVIALELDNKGLSGTLPPELGGLTSLVILTLSHNLLSGSLPSELGNLINVEWLELQDNYFTEELPRSLTGLTLLRYFLFYDNAGLCAPDDDGFQSWLQSISNFFGITCGQALPPDPRDVAALTSLYNSTNGDNWTVNRNWLTSIPLEEWEGVTTNSNGRVVKLRLGGKNLSGQLPTELGDLEYLNYLDLGNNQLTGGIPPELAGLAALEHLDLSRNQLTDNIPSALGNLIALVDLDLHQNQLTGSIPPQLDRLVNLKFLDLRENQLTGSIPSELASLASSLLYLELAGNRLTGEIPSELSIMTQLLVLDVANNRLTGTLPSNFINLTSLSHFYFQNNSGLCAPVDSTFQTWLQALFDYKGDTCGNTQPPTPTLPACVESLPSDMTVSGTWSTDCTSSIDAPRSSGDRYARFYTFSLDAESDVTIDLSSDEDTYLYLRSGASTDGTVTHENDDRATDNYDSMIEERLDPGTYTVEATTYAAGVTGSFTLAVTVVPVPDTTELEPPPGPAPDPTTLIPESCALQSFSGTSVNDSWTSDCVSQNRTENGAHYAKFFSFSVSRSATYDITLVSRTDPYLILLDSAGDIIDSDDDDDSGLFNLGSRNSGIRIALDPGDYIFEATTYAGSATGDFTLTILRP